MSKSLSFITRVDMIDCEQLQNSKFIPTIGVILSTNLVFTPIEIVGYANLETTESIENKTRIYNQALTCYLTERFSVGNKKYAFRLTDHNGKQFILGTAERPYPIVSFSDSIPAELTGKCAVQLTVNYLSTSIYPILNP